MNFLSREGRTIDLSTDTVESLKTALHGPVIAEGEAGYEVARTVWNAMIDRRPALVARCQGVADVVAAVRFAREHDLLLAMKGGGHNIAGLAVADGALLLDMSLMKGVWVDPAGMVAHAQPGCLLADVDRETQVHGLATVLGFVSQTGITGLTLGGGFGYLTRRWGWTSDNVLAFQLVTAAGEVVRASEKSHPDLFWALRGGGGNFGVVTGIDYRLYPVGPEVVGGIVAWPLEQAAEVCDLYRETAAHAPPELTLVLFIRPAPPAPWLPPEYHGKMIAAMLACHSGEPGAAEKAVQPLKAFGKPIGDVLIRRPYTQVQGLLDATQPKGRRYYWKSEYLASLEPEFSKRFIHQARHIRSPYSAAIVFQLGGAVNKFGNDHSAVGNRDAQFVLNLTSSWEDAAEDDQHIAWARDAWHDLRAFSTGGTYLNFLTDDEGLDRTEAALGDNVTRLKEIKKTWDPENVFRTNKNIVPR